jgi:hypothetical protein
MLDVTEPAATVAEADVPVGGGAPLSPMQVAVAVCASFVKLAELDRQFKDDSACDCAKA